MYTGEVVINAEHLRKILKITRKLYDNYIGSGFKLTEREDEDIFDIVKDWLPYEGE